MRTFLFALLVLMSSSCSPTKHVGPSQSGSRLQSVRLADAGPGTTGGNPAVVVEDYDLSKMAPLKYLGMCLDIDDEIRFTNTSSSEKKLNALEQVPKIDLPHGIMAIKVKGLPAGTYTQIEVPLNDGCGGSPAVGIQNGFGAFDTNHGMDLVFEGSFVAPAGSEKSEVTIFLDIRNYVNALARVSSKVVDKSTDRTPIELAIENNRGQIANGF